MAKLKLSMAVSIYDRTAALVDGRVQPEGCELIPILLSPEETFHRAFGDREFDITEISLSSHTLTTARGDTQYVGIPAFPSRVFRHSGIYIRTDKGIKTPADLKGKTIGLPEYQQTANVWIRGILEHDYGVKPSDIHWRTGGTEQPGRKERTPIKVTEGVDLQAIPNTRTLNEMLEKGEIDAVLTPKEPPCFTEKKPNIGRLFPDYEPVEQEWFKKTGIFPIMHLVGIRRSLVEQHPWLPVSVYKAFIEAKKLALEELGLIGHLAVTLPWPVAALDKARKLMGEDFWPYGIEENRKQLEVFAQYSYEQGLSSRVVPVNELFAHSTHDLSKV